MRKHYDFSGGRRGAVVAATKRKTRITIRLDDDVLEWFRRQVDDAGGGSYQTMINQVLRAHIETKCALTCSRLPNGLAFSDGPASGPSAATPC